MTYQDVRDKMAAYLSTGAVNENPLVDADRDRYIYEAYFQVFAAFFEGFRYSADYIRSGNVFTAGLSSERNWLACEGCDVKVGADYLPLKRQSFGQVLSMASGEGATGLPELYALSLSSRGAASSVFRIAVYPIPAPTSQTYRFRIKTVPVELVANADPLAMEDKMGEYVARVAAMRCGDIMGYSDEWLKEIALPLPFELQREAELAIQALWPLTAEPRLIGDLGDGF